ncbi:RidA family protein [Sinorhizobium americanum]|uniref:RidA family protein n=1 Tax=Sinorhizobium americanum TaxID=194963 RepID=UPI0014053E9C|nr:RidA family protein [Sinorhizobium americanum]
MGYFQIARVAAGDLAFISGQVGVDLEWGLASSFQEQTELAFKNLKTAIEGCGATLADVCKLTIFVVDDAELEVYTSVRDTFFSGQINMPASSFIRVAGLYIPEALIEIEAVVAIGNQDRN